MTRTRRGFLIAGYYLCWIFWFLSLSVLVGFMAGNSMVEAVALYKNGQYLWSWEAFGYAGWYICCHVWLSQSITMKWPKKDLYL